MRKTVAMILILLAAACTSARECGVGVSGAAPDIRAHDGYDSRADRYLKAYPGFFASYSGGCLITRTGEKIPFDDGRMKDLDALAADQAAGDDAFDPEDALEWEYPAGAALPSPSSPPAHDPGRIRPVGIFGLMYGFTGPERAGKLRTVTWPVMGNGKGRTVSVTTVNGVDAALEQVAGEIRRLPESRKRELQGVVFGTDGPYGHCDRPVRGFPGRTSGHAYGISVDINGNLECFHGAHRGEPYRYRNNVPPFLVEIFERHGFIWGCRWRSYDAMHFEYRPEPLHR